MKIWYLTRSYPPFQNGGGPLIRKASVEYLSELGWNVSIVMPNYYSNEYDYIDNIIQIPLKFNKKFSILLEMAGIYEDYLDKWVNEAFAFLKERVSCNDIIFASSGGELANIKLGSLLKKEIGCRLILNFHDPIVFTKVHNLLINNRFHVSREDNERRYISNADFIITSSKSFQKNLISKYPELENIIFNNYFGYIQEVLLLEKAIQTDNKLAIAYVGNMESTQKPEILYDIFKNLNNNSRVKIYFIGKYKAYKPFRDIDNNIEFIEYLPHNQFLEFMQKNIDIGFVSLSNDYLGACVPSKIYEYINLAIPMLGALPVGDGRDIINNNGYGIACKYDDIDGLTKAVEQFLDNDFLFECKKNIIADRGSWSMKEKILEVDKLLRELS